MDKDEMIEFLKDNLKLDIRVGPEYGARGDVVTIKLVMEGYTPKDYVISEVSFSLPSK